MVTITSNKHAGELADATINEDSDDYMFQQDGCPAHFILFFIMTYDTISTQIFLSKIREKNLCHSRDSSHRSPVFRTGALTT